MPRARVTALKAILEEEAGPKLTDIEATERQEGVAAFRSMTSAVALGRKVGVALGSGSRGFPPTMSTLPSAYITDEP